MRVSSLISDPKWALGYIPDILISGLVVMGGCTRIFTKWFFFAWRAVRKRPVDFFHLKFCRRHAEGRALSSTCIIYIIAFLDKLDLTQTGQMYTLA